MSPARRRSRVALVPGLLALLASCSVLDHYLPEATPAPVPLATAYRAASDEQAPPRRVVILPFQDLTGHEDQAAMVQRALVDELQKRQPFEVVALDRSALLDPDEKAFFRSGVVRKDTLVRLSQRYSADAVLYGVVTRYHPYEPMALGVQVTLVSAKTGDVRWSSNAIFDAGDAEVVQDVHNFHDTHLASSGSLEGWRLILISPSRFITYACSRIADTL